MIFRVVELPISKGESWSGIPTLQLDVPYSADWTEGINERLNSGGLPVYAGGERAVG